MCIFLVLLTCIYHGVRFRECKNSSNNPKHTHQGLKHDGNDDDDDVVNDDSIEMCQSVLRHPVGLYDLLSFCMDVKLGLLPSNKNDRRRNV